MQIFVRSPSGRSISLRVYPDETLQDVKKKILGKHNLAFDGVRMDQEYLTLAAYNIQHQSTLDLQEKMQIDVKETLHGMTFIVDVDDSSDTIDNVKDKIEAAHGFPKGRQCLVFADQQLEGMRTLADYNICKDSTLLLVLLPCPGGSMQIFVKMLEGSTKTFYVKSSDTVDSIRVKMYEIKGIRPIHQRILFGGRQLESGHTLAYYKVQKACTLHLVQRLCGC